MRAGIAERAIAAGAVLVNDVSGGLADPDMLPIVARTGAPVVLMHWRGHSREMQRQAVYDDAVLEVDRRAPGAASRGGAGGRRPGAVVLDPGIGFAKSAEHNWELLARLDELVRLGPPRPGRCVAQGVSRRSARRRRRIAPRSPSERDARERGGDGAGGAAGAWCVRVHEVAASADAVRVAAAWRAHAQSACP